MSRPVDVLAVLDALDGNTTSLKLNSQVFYARAAVAELIAADQAYDTALRALEDHYRDVAERGYLAARWPDARTLGENFVRAQMRRTRAIEAVTGTPAAEAPQDPDHAAMLRDSVRQADEAATLPSSPASEETP